MLQVAAKQLPVDRTIEFHQRIADVSTGLVIVRRAVVITIDHTNLKMKRSGIAGITIARRGAVAVPNGRSNNLFTSGIIGRTYSFHQCHFSDIIFEEIKSNVRPMFYYKRTYKP